MGALALAWSGALALALHRLARTAEHWMIACMILAGLYVAAALQLDRQPHPPATIDGLRWAFLAAALFSFYRYRRARRSD